MMQREQASEAIVRLPGAFLSEAIRATILIVAAQVWPSKVCCEQGLLDSLISADTAACSSADDGAHARIQVSTPIGAEAAGDL